MVVVAASVAELMASPSLHWGKWAAHVEAAVLCCGSALVESVSGEGGGRRRVGGEGRSGQRAGDGFRLCFPVRVFVPLWTFVT